jgi:hypothetical protein
MLCNKILQPEFTKEQIAECQKQPDTGRPCRWASGKVLFCGRFGVNIAEGQGKIIQPSKKLLMPKKPPTLADMAVHFTKAMAKWAKSGFKTVSKEIYLKRRQICYQCQPSGWCPHCGCNLWAKAALATEKCPENKW